MVNPECLMNHLQVLILVCSSFNWKHLLSTHSTEWTSHFQQLQVLSKILCYASYFQRSSRCLKVKSVVKLWYITSPPTNNVKQDRWRLLYLLTCTLYLFYEETASQGQFLLYRNWKIKSRNYYSHQICFSVSGPYSNKSINPFDFLTKLSKKW